jgi:hypothetical protein
VGAESGRRELALVLEASYWSLAPLWGGLRAISERSTGRSDRANSLKSEKKRAQTASPLLVLHAPKTAPFQKEHNTNLVNLKVARQCNMAVLAPQYAAF